MRRAVVLLLAVSGCVHAVHFVPALPEQAVQGQPESGTVEGGGIRMTVRAGGWRGAPDDLQNHVTPVEVFLENDSGRSLRVGNEQFALVAPNGFHYQAMEPREVQRLAAASYASGPAVYYGFYGAYPWPGFWRPWGYRHPYYPYSWWGGWYGAPPMIAYAEPPAPPPVPPATRGTLQAGGHVSMLLFFPVPATGLPSFDVVMELVDDRGGQLGRLGVPLVRTDHVPAAGAAAQPTGTAPSPPGAGPGAPAPSGGDVKPTAPAPAGAPPPPPASPPPPPGTR